MPLKWNIYVRTLEALTRDETEMTETKTMRPKPLQALIGELEKGRQLILNLDDNSYIQESDTSGSVGGHFRHDLNFVDAVLAGVASGVIDYNKRVRDRLIETDRVYASEKFTEAIDKLMNLDTYVLNNEVFVASETDTAMMHRSSISREIEFVHSHTVHHHALIAEKLSSQGIETGRYFGVAPSTLEYWQAGAA